MTFSLAVCEGANRPGRGAVIRNDSVKPVAGGAHPSTCVTMSTSARDARAVGGWNRKVVMDVVRRILAFNGGRDPERLRLKYRAMRASPFAFLRGSCHLFYDRLPRAGIFKSAPTIWSCGDLHLENFGSFKGDNRLVYFDVNDFDEAAIAPATWDLVRMVTSLRLAADNVTIRKADAEGLCALFVDSYAAALAIGKAYWVERDTATGLVGTLLDGLRTRQRADFLNTRTRASGKRRVLRVDGTKALPATGPQRRVIDEFMAGFALAQPDPAFYKVLDVARRVAGTGSLGVDRYVILVQGKGSPDGNHLLDLKLALPSVLAARVATPQPRWPTEAERVVTCQRLMQAVSPAFLQPVIVAEAAYVLRALQPSEDRLTLDAATQSRGTLEQTMQTLAGVVAWAQLRSSGRSGSASADELIDFGRRAKWRPKLLAASSACAAQVARDARVFNAAYDDGAFDDGHADEAGRA
jgi:uncharacterized protein (DUF2252 family)